MTQQDIIAEVGYSKSQIYEWLSAIRERKKRSPKQVPQEMASKALDLIVKYPHLSAPKGQLYLLYHRQGYIPQYVYALLRKTVRSIVFQEVSKRKLLPEKTSYNHERASQHGQIWAEDFTRIKVWGHLFYVALVIDIASNFYLGFAVSTVASRYFVESALQMAFVTNKEKGPERFLISDNGKQYIGEDHQSHLEFLSIVQKRIPPCRPQYNGTVECGIKEFKKVFYNVWAETLKKVPIKEKSVFDLVTTVVSETVHRLNEEIPRPCLGGVTPQDIVSGVACQKIQAREHYLEQEQQRKDIPAWTKTRWKLAHESLKSAELTSYELVIKFCFFLKRSLQKVQFLPDVAIHDTS
jgi:transposase InsO family protein